MVEQPADLAQDWSRVKTWRKGFDQIGQEPRPGPNVVIRSIKSQNYQFHLSELVKGEESFNQDLLHKKRIYPMPAISKLLVHQNTQASRRKGKFASK